MPDTLQPSAAAVATATARAAPLLDVRNIVKRYTTSEGGITAVDDVSFTVGAGEFVSIIGPSGCGKSTLFNIVGGLIGDYQGSVAVDAGQVVVVDVRVKPGYTPAMAAGLTPTGSARA